MEAKKKNPHAQFYGLLAKMPGADKDDLVWQYSSMMTTSLNEFLQKKPREYYQMLNDLRNITKDALQLQYDEERKIKKTAFRHFAPPSETWHRHNRLESRECFYASAPHCRKNAWRNERR